MILTPTGMSDLSTSFTLSFFLWYLHLKLPWAIYLDNPFMSSCYSRGTEKSLVEVKGYFGEKKTT